MQVTIKQGSIADAQVDAVVVNLFQGVTEPAGATGSVNTKIGGLISKLIAAKEFKGKLNEVAVLHLADAAPFRKVILVGLGEANDFSQERVRQVSATALKAAVKGDTRQVATIVHGAGIGGLDVAEAAQATAEGALLSQYRYDDYRTKGDDDDHTPPGVELIVYELDAAKMAAVEAGIARGIILAEATNFARDLVNAPANDLTPAVLAQKAQDMAAATGLECEILDRKQMEELGMGSLLGVAQGSAQPPKLIVLRHRGAEGDPVALVGKGVTFDTGGISIKPAAGMGAMKGDMAGAAAVIGAMQAIAKLDVKQHVIAVAGCVENMPSSTALKPGDILRSMIGKTIEVDNTDAEGRLVLADAVAYAEKLGAHTIVDVATLTGACIIALGNLYTAVIGNDDGLIDELLAAGDRAGERYWHLPSDADFKEQYKSDVADIKNTGGREAGTITGGLFIGEFVQDARWAHLDIAGTSATDKPRHYLVKGATGVGVRTLTEFVQRL